MGSESKVQNPKEMEKMLDEVKAKQDEEIMTTFNAIKNLLTSKRVSVDEKEVIKEENEEEG